MRLAGSSPFDLSKPAIRLAPDPAELRLFNLSGLEVIHSPSMMADAACNMPSAPAEQVFGAHCLARHWALALASSFLLGLKGPILGAGIWALYKFWTHGGCQPAQ